MDKSFSLKSAGGDDKRHDIEKSSTAAKAGAFHLSLRAGAAAKKRLNP
jgi:hypothetical protein